MDDHVMSFHFISCHDFRTENVIVNKTNITIIIHCSGRRAILSCWTLFQNAICISHGSRRYTILLGIKYFDNQINNNVNKTCPNLSRLCPNFKLLKIRGCSAHTPDHTAMLSYHFFLLTWDILCDIEMKRKGKQNIPVKLLLL